ncbi:MAG: class I SAM-dependent methyltransferase, partial [Myxococcota bacterium]
MAKKKAKKKKKGKRKAVALAETMASRADRYELYLQSVQAPDVDVKFFQRVYKSNFKRPAQVLREDFCGTAAVCCEWVGKRGEREAYGVDLDPEPLEWGQRYNLPLVPDGRRDAVHFVEGDVRSAKT